jgi:hypothetical protein
MIQSLGPVMELNNINIVFMKLLDLIIQKKILEILG